MKLYFKIIDIIDNYRHCVKLPSWLLNEKKGVINFNIVVWDNELEKHTQNELKRLNSVFLADEDDN